MTTNQGNRQESFRALGGTTGSYNEDSYAAFIAGGATAGNTYNGAFIEWLQAVIPSTKTDINDLKAEFAIAKGAASWSQLGTFTIFDPTDISNLALWLDASDADTIIEETGVAQWDDKSGNEVNLLQGTGSDQPLLDPTGLNGLPTVTFTDDWLQSTKDLGATSNSETVFFVINYVDNGVIEGIYAHEDTFYGGRIRSDSDNKVDVLVGNFTDGSNAIRSSPAWTVNPVVAGSRYSISDNLVEVYQGDTITASGTLTTATTRADGVFALSSVRGLVKELALVGSSISEFVLYDRKLTDAEVTLIVDYLTAKWSI